jgi:hypothetical protein
VDCGRTFVDATAVESCGSVVAYPEVTLVSAAQPSSAVVHENGVPGKVTAPGDFTEIKTLQEARWHGPIREQACFRGCDQPFPGLTICSQVPSTARLRALPLLALIGSNRAGCTKGYQEPPEIWDCGKFTRPETLQLKLAQNADCRIGHFSFRSRIHVNPCAAYKFRPNVTFTLSDTWKYRNQIA